MQVPEYDVCVIGGGINGAGIARDAAGRGLSVILLEANDLGSATSSSSSKLIHGGLRYLEQWAFRLVRDSLKEREIILNLAPHIVRPMDFILPHDANLRPYPLIRAGLFLYDLLGGRQSLKRSAGLNLQNHIYGLPLKEQYKKGLRYSDCWVDDSRLVVLNAVSAAAKGASIRTRTVCTKLMHSENNHWLVSMKDLRTGVESEIKADMVVNATGPWVRGVIESSNLVTPAVPKIRLVKGSHIVIKRAHEGAQTYILQQPDKRVVFVIPYEKEYTLIGTTDVDYIGDPVQAQISPEETDYLCTAYNTAFKNPIMINDILWTYSGVRPLFDDGKSASRVTRDYKLYHHKEFKAPMISVFGGKLTTFRVLSEQVVNELLYIGSRPGRAWTSKEALPGGDVPKRDMKAFIAKKAEQYDWLPEDVLQRYARSYGTCMDRFLDGARGMADLGHHYGDHVYEAEIVYLVRTEFAQTAEDIFWRRSKLGLHVSEKTMKAVEAALSDFMDKAA